MAANTIDLAKIVHERIAPMIAEYGLELPAFYIENISLPAEVEAALDKRTSTSASPATSRSYTEFSAAEAMTKSAANPGGGGGMAAGIGMGMGMAMAERMARTRPLGRGAGRRPAPTPAAAARRRSAGTSATDGKATGPYTRDELGRMVARRARRPATAGSGPRAGPDWQRGRDVTELADLFSAPPPPPPAG